MKILSISIKVLALIFCISTYVHSAPESNNSNNSVEVTPTQEVANLIKKMAIAESDKKKVILSKINLIRIKNPDNTNILLMYISGLISEKRYNEGVEYLKLLYKKRPVRTYLLTQCMLQERTGRRDDNCYKQVIQLSEENKIIDSDYITALFFTDEGKFIKTKDEVIKENKFKESDFFAFSLGREKMLHEFFP